MSVHFQKAEYLIGLDPESKGALDGISGNFVEDDVGESSEGGDIAKKTQHGTCSSEVVYAASTKLVCMIMARCDLEGIGLDRAVSRVLVVMALSIPMVDCASLASEEKALPPATKLTATLVG